MSNHYTRAIRQIICWPYRHGRPREDTPLLLKMLNVDVDRRHDRRALSGEEVAEIPAVAESCENGPRRFR